MEKVIISKLKDLFINNNHTKLLEICEHLILKTPDDIELLYCAGSAALMTGNTQKGFEYFEQLLNIIDQTIDQTIDRERLLFLSGCVLQIADFIIFFNDSDKTKIYNDSVKYANLIAHRTGNQELLIRAEDLKDRIINIGQGKTYIFPKSPEILQIEPTNHCNLKCTMCPRTSMSRKSGYMKITLWEKIIQNWSRSKNEYPTAHLVFNTQYTLQNVGGTIKMFFLGEPLLHPEFDSFIKIAKKEGCRIGIQTNGVLLEKLAIRQRLLNARPDDISLSMDGIDQASYNSVRQGSNWNTIFNSIKSLNIERKEMGLVESTAINVSTILLDKSNNTNINQVLAFFKPLGQYIDNLNAISLDRSYNPVFLDTKGELQKYNKLNNSQIKMNQPLCEEPLTKLNILWDGTVTPCCHDINGEIKLGDSNTNSIDEIWMSKRTRSLHIALLTHDTKDYPFCRACKE